MEMSLTSSRFFIYCTRQILPTATGTFSDNTVILTSHNQANSEIAYLKYQLNLLQEKPKRK